MRYLIGIIVIAMASVSVADPRVPVPACQVSAICPTFIAPSITFPDGSVQDKAASGFSGGNVPNATTFASSVTASAFFGDGSHLSGISNGFNGGTVANQTTFQSSVTVQNALLASSSVTASSFFGDGSHLTGIAGGSGSITYTVSSSSQVSIPLTTGKIYLISASIVGDVTKLQLFFNNDLNGAFYGSQVAENLSGSPSYLFTTGGPGCPFEPIGAFAASPIFSLVDMTVPTVLSPIGINANTSSSDGSGGVMQGSLLNCAYFPTTPASISLIQIATSDSSNFSGTIVVSPK